MRWHVSILNFSIDDLSNISKIGAVRRILRIQLGTKPVTRMDMEDLRAILLDLQLQLNSIIRRIPEGNPEHTSGAVGRAQSMSKSPVDTHFNAEEYPGEGLNGCAEQYHSPVLVSFHKWAKIILGLYIDKVRPSYVLTL